MRRSIWLAITVLVIPSLLAACAPAVPTVVPTKPSAPAAATAAPAQQSAPVAPTAILKPAAAATSAPSAPQATPTTQVKRGGTLRGAIVNDYMSLAPYITASPVPYPLFDSPIRWRPGPDGIWGPQPGLLLSWEQKGNEAIFKLRQKVKFHDGTEWNAKVAKWNFERISTHPKSNLKNHLGFIDPQKGIEVIDDYTLKVNLKAPSATMPANLSDAEIQMFMISKEAADKLGDDQFGRRPVGSGPFEFVDWKPADRLTLKRFGNYWREGVDGQSLPYLEGLVYRFIADDAVRFVELRSSNIDLAELIHGKDLPTARADPRLTAVEGPWIGNRYRMSMNTIYGPFSNNIKLRQAAFHAIDKDSIAKTLGLGAGQGLKYELMPGIIGYDETLPYYEYNAEKAKQLVKEAGFPSGVGVELTITARMIDQQQAEMIKSMWDAVGIQTAIDAMERVAWAQKVREARGEFDVVTSRGAGPLADPGLDLTSRHYTKGISNDTRYTDPNMDKCLDEGDRTTDPKQRHGIFLRCQRMAHEAAYHNFLWVQVWNWVHVKELRGFEPSWGSYWQVAGVWFDR